MCTVSTKKKSKEKDAPQDKPEQQPRAKLAEETKTVTLFEGNKSKQVIISALLDPKTEAELIQFLHDNNDIFTWSAEDLRGVDRSVIEYVLDAKARLPTSQAKSPKKCLKKENK
jgi:hypothetical protein